jgi:hypothetical protein
MKYLLLVYQSEEDLRREAGEGVTMQDYLDYANSLFKGGNYVTGEALEPTSRATTVRVKDGKTLTTDGPFAETKEHLGGFYIVNATDTDEALSWASKTSACIGRPIEVRSFFDARGA